MNKTRRPRSMDDYVDNIEAYADSLDPAERDKFLKSPVWSAHCKFTSSPMVDSGIDWASLIRTVMKARGITTSSLVEMVRGRISKQTIYNLLNSRIVNAHVLGTVITAVGMVVRLEPNPLKPLKAAAPVKPAKAVEPAEVALPVKPGRQYRKAWLAVMIWRGNRCLGRRCGSFQALSGIGETAHGVCLLGWTVEASGRTM